MVLCNGRIEGRPAGAGVICVTRWADETMDPHLGTAEVTPNVRGAQVLGGDAHLASLEKTGSPEMAPTYVPGLLLSCA